MSSAIAWACPADEGCLEAEASGDGLHCHACGRRYSVPGGIPDFIGQEAPQGVQRFERERRERWVEFEGDRRVRYERGVEEEAVVSRVRPRAGQRVLDAGCGVGRITRRLLAAGAEVWAVDFSRARLETLRAGARAHERLRLAVADIQRLPLGAGGFDGVVSTQVLEHIPGREARQRVLERMRGLLAPGGRLVLTVYNYSRPWQRRGCAQEGLHETGIFYHCYEAEELREDLGGFRQVRISGLIHLLPHTYRLLPRLGAAGRWLDHGCERFPQWGSRWGHLLLAEALA